MKMVHWTATENWASQVNDAGWGLGVWNPDTLVFSGGFFSKPYRGDPQDSPKAILPPPTDRTSDFRAPYARAAVLTQLGKLEEARSAARCALELNPNSPATILLRQLLVSSNFRRFNFERGNNLPA